MLRSPWTLPFSASLVCWIGLAVGSYGGGAYGGERQGDDELALAGLLPPSTVIYLEVASPASVLETVLNHPLRPKIEAIDQVQESFEKKQFLDFKAGVAIVESQLGTPWRKLLGQVMGGGIALGLDAKSQGVAVLLSATDDTVQTRLLETLANLAKLDATNKGNANPVKSVDYRGLKAFGVDKAKFVVLGRHVAVSNKDDLIKWIADCYLDRPAATLATNETFTRARSGRTDGAVAWGWLNSGALRDAGVAKEVYNGRADNALAELLFGGILSTLQHTPYLTGTLGASGRQATLTFSAPFDRAWAGESREYFFGPDGKGAAPAAIPAKNELFSLSTYRDISAMWLRAGELFDEKANDELAKADSNLSTLFGGKDFGEDILGSFAPEMRLIVTQQEYAPGQPQPAIKIPAFSFIFQLKDPDKMQPELRRTFQSLIGFLNIVGAMNGQPQLELDMEKSEGMQLITASYLPDAKAKDLLGLRLHYNFSPSVAFAGDRIVIASTKGLARELVSAAPAQLATKPGTDAAVNNTNATLSFDRVRAALADNRAQLVAQNMLEEGHTKEEAEKAIDLLLELIGWLDSATLQLGSTDKELKLSISLSIDE